MHAVSPESPAFSVLHAELFWKRIDFVSDLHLSPATPKTLAAFTSYLLATPADAVMILGDLFEAWVGDDARHGSFEQQVASALAGAARLRRMFFMLANRDFLLGPDMLSSCGVEALLDPSVLVAFGRRAILTHGDSLCITDQGYQRFRTMVRQATWQRDFLSRPLENRREEARRLRSESHEVQNAAGGSHRLVSDVDPAAVLDWMEAARAELLIHGHTHRPGSHSLRDGRSRLVLSDWDFDSCGQAPRGEVLSWEARGMTRHSLETAASPT